MDTIFMNSKSSKTSDPHRLLLSLYDKLNLKRSDNMLGYQILALIYMEKCKKNHIRVWNLKFELPDESYSVSDIQDYFKYILKNHEKVTDNPSIMIYAK